MTLRSWTRLHHTTNTHECKNEHVRSQIYLKHHKPMYSGCKETKHNSCKFTKVKALNTATSSFISTVVTKFVYQLATLWYISDHQSHWKQPYIIKRVVEGFNIVYCLACSVTGLAQVVFVSLNHWPKRYYCIKDIFICILIFKFVLFITHLNIQIQIQKYYNYLYLFNIIFNIVIYF